MQLIVLLKKKLSLSEEFFHRNCCTKLVKHFKTSTLFTNICVPSNYSKTNTTPLIDSARRLLEAYC